MFIQCFTPLEFCVNLIGFTVFILHQAIFGTLLFYNLHGNEAELSGKFCDLELFRGCLMLQYTVGKLLVRSLASGFGFGRIIFKVRAILSYYAWVWELSILTIFYDLRLFGSCNI